MPVTRLFESEHDVQHALEHLKATLAEELIEPVEPQEFLLVINPADPTAGQAVDAGIAGGAIRGGHRRHVNNALARGRWVVAAAPSWTIEGLVEKALDKHATDPAALPDIPYYDPTPFSDFLGIPVLTSGESDTDLIDFDLDSSFGLNLVIDNPAPLSSLFRLPLLKQSKSAQGTAVARMSGTPAPFSSLFKLPLLTSGKKGGAKGSSVARMSSNAAPFSKLLGLPVLTKRR